MTINDKEMVLLAVVFVIVILRLYINSLTPKKIDSSLPAKIGCPGDGTGKLHKWQYDLENGGYICTTCNKKPGQIE